jgi:hypothetical protein
MGDDVRYSFYEELECVFGQFQKNHMKILLGDFNENGGREYILKQRVTNESLQEIRNDNEVTVTNFATPKMRFV